VTGIRTEGSGVPNAALTDEQLLNRVIWRVLPLVTACMVIGTIDRSNIGFAKLSMANSLGMSEATFALGSSLFYLGYLLFEVPSALAAHRYGARIWFARIMATWGLATLLLGFTGSATEFYVLRFMLGVAEAGLYPGLLYYITLWMPRAHQARAMGFLTIGSAIGNGMGALISGPLLDMNGVMGLQGWQWIFLVTGAMPMIGVFFVWSMLRDTPAQATFLTEPEKARLISMIDSEPKRVTPLKEVFAAIANTRVLGHGVAYATILTALYGVIYWSPSIVKTFGVTGTQNGMLVALPWAVDVVLLLTLPRRLRSQESILKAMAWISIIGVVAFASAVVVENSYFRYGCLLAGIPAVSLVVALYWTFPVRLFKGAQSAAAIGAICMFGNFAGLIGQNMMPAVAALGGSASAALWVPCVCLGAIMAGALVTLARKQQPVPALGTSA
jgi:MFS family permease